MQFLFCKVVLYDIQIQFDELFYDKKKILYLLITIIMYD